jgi:hypothetical protein
MKLIEKSLYNQPIESVVDEPHYPDSYRDSIIEYHRICCQPSLKFRWDLFAGSFLYLSMRSSEQIIQTVREVAERLKLRYPIRSMALFGSVTRDDFGPESDIDILVEFDGAVGSRFIDLALELEAHLGRKVDLVSRKGIQEKYFQEIAQDLRYV